MTEVCSQVCTEPELQPVNNPDKFCLSTSNTQEGAHLDITMNGYWDGHSERCFVADVRMFNPLAPSNSSSSFSSTFKKHENVKHQAYGQRIHEAEHASFTPIIMLGWLTKPQFSSSIWPLSYRLSRVTNTLVDFDVALDFVCSGLLFSAFEVHAHPFVFSIGLYHQWT